MKKKNKLQNDGYLFHRVAVLWGSNLEDPKLAEEARQVLSHLRRRGYKIDDPDLDSDGCVACLHLALLCALEAEPVSSNASSFLQ